MSKIIICVGISGSGKSSWSTQFIKDNNNYLRINRDDIRRVLVGDLVSYYTREDVNSLEGIVSSIQNQFIDRIKYKDYNLVIDNTHLRREYIQFIIDYIGPAHTVQFKLFDCDLLEAKNRVATRDNYPLSFDENHVTTCKYVDYIDKQYQQYQSIKKWILETYPDNIIK